MAGQRSPVTMRYGEREGAAMTITISLTPEQEACVAAIAGERGTSVEQVVAQMIADQLALSPGGSPSGGAASPIPSPAPRPSADDPDEQRRLHSLLLNLFARSDALERQPGAPAAVPRRTRVHTLVREKHRARGLRV